MKRQQPFQVQIPKPCHESWDEMHTRPQGRFCDHCEKTVIDFSVMSDEEIRKKLSDQQGSVCGRFAANQLNRDFHPFIQPKKPAFDWRSWIAGLFMAGSSSQGNAQEQTDSMVPPMTVSPASQAQDSLQQPTLAPKHFFGRLTTKKGAPLDAWLVQVPELGLETKTNAQGYFSITLPDSLTDSLAHNTLKASFGDGDQIFTRTFEVEQLIHFQTISLKALVSITVLTFLKGDIIMGATYCPPVTNPKFDWFDLSWYHRKFDSLWSYLKTGQSAPPKKPTEKPLPRTEGILPQAGRRRNLHQS